MARFIRGGLISNFIYQALFLLLFCIFLVLVIAQPETKRAVTKKFEISGEAYAFGDINQDGFTDVITYSKANKLIKYFAGEIAGIRKDYSKVLANLGENSYEKDCELVNILLLDIRGQKRSDLLLTLFYLKTNKYYVYLVLLDGVESSKTKFIVESLGIFNSEPIVLDVCKSNKPLLLATKDGEESQKLYKYESSQLIVVPMKEDSENICKSPRDHSNAYLDLNGNCLPDIFVMCENNKFGLFEINEDGDSIKNIFIGNLAQNLKSYISFADVSMQESLDAVYIKSKNDTHGVLMYSKTQSNSEKNGEGRCLQKREKFSINFGDENEIYYFPMLKNTKSELIRIVVADWDMNGHGDFIFASDGEIHIVLNTGCKTGKCSFSRNDLTLKSMESGKKITAVAIFDLHENGIPDLVVVYQDKMDANTVKTGFFEKDYKEDAFSIKACTIRVPNESKNYRGNSLVSIGSSVLVAIHNVIGERIEIQVHQMTQTSSKSLQLPCALIGLGRTTNFLPFIRVVAEQCTTGTFREIVPNSLLVFTRDIEEWNIHMVLHENDHLAKVCLAVGIMLVLIGAIAGAFKWQEKIADGRQRTYWM